jgi:cell cycle checkpoint protein
VDFCFGYSLISSNTLDLIASLVDRFGLFLTSASRYSTLAMELDDDDGATSPTKPTVALDIPLTHNATSPRRVIVLEDLPNVNHLPTRSSFNTALEAFLYQESDQSIPLILILSENIPRLDDWGAEGSGSNYKDRNEATLTIRNLIPAPIRNNPRFQQIE